MNHLNDRIGHSKVKPKQQKTQTIDTATTATFKFIRTADHWQK